MAYADGFVIAVPKRKLAKYRSVARRAGKVWREHGCLDYRECVGDDLAIKGVISFTKLARLKKGETVVFSWIVYKSRAHRDAVNKKVMADPRMLRMMKEMKEMPSFDMHRMAYGGFKVIVDNP
jgi:alkaline phosphatase